MNDETCDKILKPDYDCIYNTTCDLCECVLDNNCYFFCLECWNMFLQ